MFSAETKAVDDTVTNAPETIVTWKHIAKPVEPFLEAVAERLARQVREFDPSIVPYAEYALTGQGKQLRPALVAMTANAMGRCDDAHTTVAVIIEMVHLATLVHDDVMDEAEIRRGRATLGANWGNEIAVLFGDCLFAQALKLAASFPTTEVCRAVSAATNTVCTGEILQTRQRRNFDLTEAEYFKALEMKTGELFALSCDLSAFLSDAPELARKALRDYGTALGTAYQIYDDCLDLFGSEAVAGKSLGTDLAKGKLTLPVLRFLREASPADAARMKEMLKNWEPKSLGPVLELLVRQETLADSVQTINEYLTQARKCLKNAGPTANITGLVALTHFLARQTESLGICA